MDFIAVFSKYSSIRLISEEQTNLVPLQQIYGHTLAITGISVAFKSTFLYSSSKDGTIKSWDLFNGNELSSFSLSSPINTIILVFWLWRLKFKDNIEAWLYAGCENGNIYKIIKGSEKSITLSAHKYFFKNSYNLIKKINNSNKFNKRWKIYYKWCARR